VLNHKFHYIAKALDYLPADTVLDGELVAMGPDGKPNFNLLQNFKSAVSHITYYAFDVLMHKGRDLTQVPLSERRAGERMVLKDAETQKNWRSKCIQALPPSNRAGEED
jgi:ATP-dependent DNA ligase